MYSLHHRLSLSLTSTLHDDLDVNAFPPSQAAFHEVIWYAAQRFPATVLWPPSEVLIRDFSWVVKNK